MKRIILLSALICAATFANAQATDIEIIDALLGENYLNINTKLEKMGVWYYFYIKQTDFQLLGKRFYSIENSDKSTKSWVVNA